MFLFKIRVSDKIPEAVFRAEEFDARLDMTQNEQLREFGKLEAFRVSEGGPWFIPSQLPSVTWRGLGDRTPTDCYRVTEDYSKVLDNIPIMGAEEIQIDEVAAIDLLKRARHEFSLDPLMVSGEQLNEETNRRNLLAVEIDNAFEDWGIAK